MNRESTTGEAGRRNTVAAPGLRILVLSKRQYMGQDLIDQRFGRFRELPLRMSALGAEVRGVCLSYRPKDEGLHRDSEGAAAVEWQSLNLRRLFSPARRGYLALIDSIGREFAPDIVWAASDAPPAVLGVLVARRLRARLAIDLYDNFESFGLARVPGLNAALRWAVRSADLVTCVSAPLQRMVSSSYQPAGCVGVIENAVPADFRQVPRARARDSLGLPADALLVGTAGALSSSRGIECLLQAFERLSLLRPSVHLVLAGAADGSVRLPGSPRIHHLGLLPPERVPEVLSALDVSVICNRDSAFGRFCFPQKFHESLACRVPMAVARVGSMAELLSGYPRLLFAPEDPDDLVRAILGQLADPIIPELAVPTWSDQARELHQLLQSAAVAR